MAAKEGIMLEALLFIAALIGIAAVAHYAGVGMRVKHCRCEGCLDDEPGWLSKEYQSKYPNCKYGRD